MKFVTICCFLLLLGLASANAVAQSAPRQLSVPEKTQLLKDREAVWRAWFAGDEKELKALLPAETLAINAGEEQWQNLSEILAGAREFVKSGGKLVKLEFPKTEIQVYGNVAIIYSQYAFELEVGGQRTTTAGRVTEIFVRGKKRWLNPGWHMDSGK